MNSMKNSSKVRMRKIMNNMMRKMGSFMERWMRMKEKSKKLKRSMNNKDKKDIKSMKDSRDNKERYRCNLMMKMKIKLI